MATLVKQEIFKLTKKKSTWICTAFLIIIQIAMAIAVKTYPRFMDPSEAFSSMFLGGALVVFFMIAASATIITMEFQYGTIKELLYRRYFRGQIWTSKWITMFLYSIYWFVLTFIISLLLKMTLFNSQIDFSQMLSGNNTVLGLSIKTLLANFLTLWLILSLVFLLANIFKNSAAAVSVGIIGYFATSIISSILMMLIQKWEWVKWNPFTMLYLPGQVQASQMSNLTKLSINQMITGNFVYIIIFFVLGYWIFKKRSV